MSDTLSLYRLGTIQANIAMVEHDNILKPKVTDALLSACKVRTVEPLLPDLLLYKHLIYLILLHHSLS